MSEATRMGVSYVDAWVCGVFLLLSLCSSRPSPLAQSHLPGRHAREHHHGGVRNQSQVEPASAARVISTRLGGMCKERNDKLKDFLKKGGMVCCSYCRFASQCCCRYRR